MQFWMVLTCHEPILALEQRPEMEIRYTPTFEDLLRLNWIHWSTAGGRLLVGIALALVAIAILAGSRNVLPAGSDLSIWPLLVLPGLLAFAVAATILQLWNLGRTNASLRQTKIYTLSDNYLEMSTSSATYRLRWDSVRLVTREGLFFVLKTGVNEYYFWHERDPARADQLRCYIEARLTADT